MTAVVTPPAVSVKMPSVSASSWMPETISTSETSSAQPPVSRIILRGGGAVGRVADGERARDGVGALRLDVVRALLDGVRDGRAAGGLRAEEADGLVFDQAKRDQLVEGLADLADQRAAGHGADDVVGQPPAELLGDLVARRSSSPRRSRGAG